MNNGSWRRLVAVWAATLLLLGSHAVANVALNLDVENLHADTVESLCPANATVVLLVSTTNSTFGDLTFTANPALAATQFTAEADDLVLATFTVGQDGVFQNAVVFDITAQITANDPLLFVWYPDLPFDSNRTGPGQGQRFGTYRSDAATQFSDIGWLVPADGSGFNLSAISVSAGGDVADINLVATLFTAGQANRPPTALCQNVTKSAGTNCQATVTAGEVDNGSSDLDNDPITVTLSPAGPFNLGVNNVTLTVADNQFGTNTCAATVTITDDTAPLITCPSTISTQLPLGQLDVVINFPAPLASDACSAVTVVSVPPSGSSFPLGTNTVVSTATDGAGNTNSCAFQIFVVAQPVTNSAPTAICQTVTKAAGANCQASVTPVEVDGGSTDPDADPLTRQLSPAGPFALGTNSVTLIVADNRGGTNSCLATVIVVDSTAPTLVCPATILAQAPAGATNLSVNYSLPLATDNCSAATVAGTPPPGADFALGTNQVVCSAWDTAGNTNTCVFFIVVNGAPTALCQEVTRFAGTNCTAEVTAAEVNAGSSDPDGDPLTLALSPAGPYAAGTNSVTLTVADNRGGTNSCLATVIVVDDTAPTVVCPSDLQVAVLPGVTSTVVNFPTLVASDNCGVAGIVFEPASGSVFSLGTTPVVGTVTDAAGNTNSCSFNVTVVTANTNTYDLAVIGVRVPKKIKLSDRQPTATESVRVTIQNRGPRSETITNLTGLVDLQVLALTNCPNLQPVLAVAKPQRELPVTLKPNQKLTVYFQVTYAVNCIPDLRKSTKAAAFNDYRYVATVRHEALDGNPDTNPTNDSFVSETLTDVYVFFY